MDFVKASGDFLIKKRQSLVLQGNGLGRERFIRGWPISPLTLT